MMQKLLCSCLVQLPLRQSKPERSRTKGNIVETQGKLPSMKFQSFGKEFIPHLMESIVQTNLVCPLEHEDKQNRLFS